MLSALYRRCLHACLDAPLIVVLVVGAVCRQPPTAAFGLIRQELTPTEDRSRAMLRIIGAAGRQPRLHAQQMRKIEDLIQPLRDSGEVDSTFAIAGTGGSVNSGFMVMTLAPWDERDAQPAGDRRRHQPVPDARCPALRAFPISAQQPRHPRRRQRPAIRRRRSTTMPTLGEAAAEDRRRDGEGPALPAAAPVDSTPTQPQLSVTIDRERASDLGIDITGLSDSACRRCSTATRSATSSSTTAAMR